MSFIESIFCCISYWDGDGDRNETGTVTVTGRGLGGDWEGRTGQGRRYGRRQGPGPGREQNQDMQQNIISVQLYRMSYVEHVFYCISYWDGDGDVKSVHGYGELRYTIKHHISSA